MKKIVIIALIGLGAYGGFYSGEYPFFHQAPLFPLLIRGVFKR
ncbi:hypothetical protein SAMN05216233_104171 [Desulfoluna spongiiphila]|uniref:Uncharacterized protein n=1 Tax=Desulfoluna spongiiphila TaxID=419481 RepID=A0A1G5DGF1_9BACT|nr:hypothetical protein SAMN05216233_104171 [Desulfoluna spongiiphila]